MVEKKQYWNLKYQIQDPIILHVYELNIVKDQLWQHSQATSELLTLHLNIIHIALKRDKQIKLSAIPYFRTRNSLVMSELENYSTLTTCWGCPSPVSP